ncbi:MULTISPECIES: succinate dehydrogenase, hydrophobic membrane anchor protein [Methylotenera]|uniref:succinate dehydrogenase, hydrophobic membrane anchor protein n=1 Tax=Methylotenera TaxID=359407 RepID=UPI00037F20F0|nr:MULTISPECIES: succinate dehydrogenase, hydrophobic membrane anchor protein [Methylotenera]
MFIQLLTHKYPGMRLWLSQRLTAVVMAIYIVSLIILLLITQPFGYATWQESYAAWYAFASPVWFRLSTLVFFMCLLMHAWLGVADVLKDYVFNKTLRAYMQMAVDIALVVYLFWLVYILWNV